MTGEDTPYDVLKNLFTDFNCIWMKVEIEKICAKKDNVMPDFLDPNRVCGTGQCSAWRGVLLGEAQGPGLLSVRTWRSILRVPRPSSGHLP